MALLIASGPGTPLAASGRESPEQPALYGELREARLEHVGRIHSKGLRVDRFDFSFEEGEL